METKTNKSHAFRICHERIQTSPPMYAPRGWIFWVSTVCATGEVIENMSFCVHTIWMNPIDEIILQSRG